MSVVRVSQLLEINGQPLVLKRPVNATGTAFNDYAVRGMVHNYASDDVKSAITQTDRRVTLGARTLAKAGLSGPPLENDRILINGRSYSVVAVQENFWKGALASYVLHAKGGYA